MSNLVLFQRQLQANNAEGIKQFLAELPQWSANEGLRQAGEAFGFPTVEIEGVRYLLGRDLARLSYKRDHTGSLQDILKRYGHKLLSLSSFPDDQGILIREAFSLDLSDFRSTLATWGDLLIVGMKGETEPARKIMAYLLEAEEKARVAQACEGITGLSPRQLQAVDNEDPILQALAQAQQLRLRQIETEKALAVQAQVQAAQAQALTTHDQALADQGRKIKAIAASQEEELRITPEQRQTLNRLIDRLANARSVARKIPIGDAYAGTRNWLRQRLGYDSLSGISRAQFPVAEGLLKTQIAREEAAVGQASLKLVKPKAVKKPKEPWGDL